jgi:nitrogen fixation NifU-like protein
VPKSQAQMNIEQAIANPQNMGEMTDADATGTVGSPDCGDMLRMWLKFTEKDGKKVIDRASFQSFGCQTAIAVASVATQMLKGKSIEEARNLSSTELSSELGPLPPMKIHCGQMVEGALKAALENEDRTTPATDQNTLAQSLAPKSQGTLKITLTDN